MKGANEIRLNFLFTDFSQQRSGRNQRLITFIADDKNGLIQQYTGCTVTNKCRGVILAGDREIFVG